MWFEQCRGGRTVLSINESVLLKHHSSLELGLGDKKSKTTIKGCINLFAHPALGSYLRSLNLGFPYGKTLESVYDSLYQVM